MSNRRIVVRGSGDGPQCGALLTLLQPLLAVEFDFATVEAAAKAGEVVFEGTNDHAEISRPPGVSVFRTPVPADPAVSGQFKEATVKFLDDADVPFPFRGRALRLKVPASAPGLVLGAGEKPLAVTEDGPVWTTQFTEGIKHFRSAFPLPTVAPEEALHEVLNGNRFLEVLPLLHWLHKLGVGAGYEGPPPRACFMFDDPNLHWPRYGYVDFQEIAKAAVLENYHVSFATVPLDVWYTNKTAAEIFRRNSERLSLLIHGNNHTYRELAGNYTADARVSLLQQAIGRIERLERKTGIAVARVMAAPHGACSEEMLQDLPRCGFEGATISHGSLRAHNRTRDWTRSIGCLPSELVHGCAVLPRWGLSLESKNSILLAAYLRQPIILIGHHVDLREGIELLDELAKFINGLGPVLWSNLTDLFQANYLWQTENGLLRVKPHARKVLLPADGHAGSLVVESAPCPEWTRWRVCPGDGPVVHAKLGEPIALPIGFVGTISLETAHKVSSVKRNGSFRVPVRNVLRRLLAEGRDRLKGQLLPSIVG